LADTTIAQKKSSNQAVIANSSSSEGLAALKKAKDTIIAQIIPLNEAYNTTQRALSVATKEGKDETTITVLKKKLEELNKEIEPFRIKYSGIEKQILEQYPSSTEAADCLVASVGRMPIQQGLASYARLSEEAKSSLSGMRIKDQLDKMQAGSPGAMASNFTSTELRGGKLSLSDYKGKYVLIDFWASWCVPCRKGNPHLLALYAKYKEKGFEIIGVASDDGREDKWREAVEKDKIGVWKHVLRGYDQEKQMAGKKNEHDISENYGIVTLPTKILIDPEGKIIGRYGSGGEDEAAIDKKLAEIFGS
jgi:thiol-disulfide isomerase/thioredoxin